VKHLADLSASRRHPLAEFARSEAMVASAAFSFDHLAEHPKFIACSREVARSISTDTLPTGHWLIPACHGPASPVSFAELSYFFFYSNRTLSVTFGHRLSTRRAIPAYRPAPFVSAGR